MIKVVIIGGSDAGISAALRARELAPQAAQVTIVVSDRYPNFSICGLPYFLSGDVPDWHNLAHRTIAEIEAAGIHLILHHRAAAIDPKRKMVAVQPKGDAAAFDLPYDRLIIGTGASASVPAVPGHDLPSVFSLRFMQDSFTIHDFLAQRQPKSAVIVGGGYIGLEMAEALTAKGLAVTVIDHGPTVLKTVAPALGQIVQAELARHGVEVVNQAAVNEIQAAGDSLRIRAEAFTTDADMVLYAVGVKPNTALGQSAGIALGVGGALQVNTRMETAVPDIYAAGDCAETFHRLLQKPVYLPLGSTAHKQGRIAGGNAVGHHQDFTGTLGTQVVKIFDLAAARTGLNDTEARGAGFDPLTVQSDAWDHKAYYPGAHKLRILVTGDRATGLLLGAQIVGDYRGEVAKRIDVFATALHHEMTVDELSSLDLSYTPPLGSPWDAVQMSGQAWVKEAI